MNPLEIISMLVGIAIVVYMMIKNWSPIIVGITAATVVILMNGLPYGATMTGTYAQAFANMFYSLFPPILVGGLLAQTYIKSNAVVTIAEKICNAVLRDNMSPKTKYAVVTFSLIIVAGVISYCGLNCLVVLIAMYPIALGVMERADIPKKYVMGILSAGVYSFSLTAPGTTATINILAMQALGTPATAGLVGGIIAAIVEIIVTTVVLTAMIVRSHNKGEHFAYGPKDVKGSADEKDRPGFVVSIIPMVVLIVCFNGFKMNIFTASLIGWLCSVVLFWKRIGSIDELKKLIVTAGQNSFGPISSVGSIVGFTSVVQLLPSFQAIINAVFAMSIPAVIILILAIALVSGLTGSSSSAIRIGIPIVEERCLAAGLTKALIHRVSLFAASTIDTLPWSSAVIINLGIADLKMEEGYPSMCVATCLATLCGTIVCAIVMYLFPFLP